jgi:hypothetical protein
VVVTALAKALSVELTALHVSHRAALDRIAQLEAQLRGARSSLEAMRDAMESEMAKMDRASGAATEATLAEYYSGQCAALRIQVAVARHMLEEPEFAEPEKT